MNDKVVDAVVEQELYDDEEYEDTQKDRYLTFRLGEEQYGFEISYVVEIVGLQRITEVPDMPDFIKGVINLRGKVIPVIDVRTRFHLPFREYNDRTCVIVVLIKETSIGLVVDAVNEVSTIPEQSIEPAPSIATQGRTSRYVRGLGKQQHTAADAEESAETQQEGVTILLDLDKLLFAEELQQLDAE